ncbi:MAG TPA: helix-turn-helix domain-containing protein [Devosia sp.]|nr:helix-turn-helix domain-containing protein [Devosia sp.]
MYDSLSSSTACRPARRRHAAPRPCNQVIALVAQKKNVSAQVLTDTRRGRLPIARARQLAMYLSHVVLGRTLAEIGEVFRRDRTTVSYACALIEDMRDDPRFDDEVAALERQIEAAMAAAGSRTHA